MNMNEDTDEREAIAILPINGWCYIHDEPIKKCDCSVVPDNLTFIGSGYFCPPVEDE
jgi:hypothetical protein